MRRGKKKTSDEPALGAFRLALTGAIPNATGQGMDGVARRSLADKASYAMGAHLWNATESVLSPNQNGQELGDRELVEMPSGLLDILP